MSAPWGTKGNAAARGPSAVERRRRPARRRAARRSADLPSRSTAYTNPPAPMMTKETGTVNKSQTHHRYPRDRTTTEGFAGSYQHGYGWPTAWERV